MGKYWLSCLNHYEWDGVNPVPPEFWCVTFIFKFLGTILTWCTSEGFFLTGSPFTHGGGGFNVA